jgi:hypothetical protein
MRKSTRDFATNGYYLREADDVDIDNSRSIRRREVEKLLETRTNCSSFYMTSDGTYYFVQLRVIYRVEIELIEGAYNVTTFEVFTLQDNGALNWCESGVDLYFSNDSEAGRITAGVVYPLGLPTPAAPTCTPIAGTMTAGTYQVAVSHYNEDTYEEGGVSPSSNPVLATAGGLTITLPAATAGATHVNVYVSTLNGSTPMLAATVLAGTPSVDLTANPITTREAGIRFEHPLPVGKLFMSNGKLCSFSGDTVYVGTPFRPGYYDTVAGYIPFPSPVTIAIENQNGTYIATENTTHWFPGDLSDVKDMIRDPLPFGGVKGTEFSHPADPTIGWFSENGFIVADLTGKATPVTYDVLDIADVPASGVSNVRWTNGYVRVFSCGYCLNLENNAVTRYTNYDFNSFAGDYGLKADGLYLLNDSAGLLIGKVGLGKHKFDSDNMKRMGFAYIGAKTVETLSLQVITPEHDYTYDGEFGVDDLSIQRVKFGKGLRANWFDLIVYNQSGLDFEIASISFDVAATDRRV